MFLELLHLFFTHMFPELTSVRYCTFLHLRWTDWPFFWNITGGKSGLTASKNRWLDVRASRLLRSSEALWMGLYFMTASASQSKLGWPCIFNSFSLTVIFRVFMTERMSHSQLPPYWEPAGGMKCHWTLCSPIWIHLSNLSSSGKKAFDYNDSNISVEWGCKFLDAWLI